MVEHYDEVWRFDLVTKRWLLLDPLSSTTGGSGGGGGGGGGGGSSGGGGGGGEGLNESSNVSIVAGT